MDGKLSAATGLQKFNVADSMSEVGPILRNLMLGEGDKTMRYLQSRLRSGREIYETGFHVCEILQERDFSLESDNRRKFIKSEVDGVFSDSKPFAEVEECNLYRFMGKLGRGVKYQRSVSTDIPVDAKKHTSYLDTAVRKFVRSLFVNEYNLGYNKVFSNYCELQLFIYVAVTGEGMINGVKMRNAQVGSDVFSISVNNISTLKRRHLKHGPLKSYRDDVKIFVDNIVKSRVFPEFDVDGFLNRYMKNDQPVKRDERGKKRESVADIQLIPSRKTSKFYKSLNE